MLLTQGVHYKKQFQKTVGLILRGRECRDIPPVRSQGGLKGPRTDSSGRLQRADCHRNTYLQLLITAWATEIYYLEWQQGSISANSSLPLEEGEQLRVNYYPSKHQSSSIPPPHPNTDHKVILQLDLKQTFHVSISLLCCVKKKKSALHIKQPLLISAHRMENATYVLESSLKLYKVNSQSCHHGFDSLTNYKWKTVDKIPTGKHYFPEKYALTWSKWAIFKMNYSSSLFNVAWNRKSDPVSHVSNSHS